jgi:predicted phage terminase large subunit-like protein
VIFQGLTREQSNQLYLEVLESKDPIAMRRLCQEDLFFLLTVAFKRKDMNHPWLYERIREVEASPNGHLDLWAREHYKSTIITYGKTIQDILVNPEITFGIFSHTRPIAKAFLEQIKRELEGNTFLQDLFPDILYKNPQSEAAKWSLDSGIIVKRKTNPKEATIEAWGVVDGQPTGKHFDGLIYDDVVTKESVSTPEQIHKVTESWRLSLNLGANGGFARYIGTRYHMHDTYKVMMDQGSVKARVYPATDNGKIDGEPVFLSAETLANKRRDFGPYVFGTQMLQNPVADNAMGFKDEWLRFYDRLGSFQGWNIYILVDPASKKKRSSDYTVMEVIGLAPDNNYYLIDAVRDRFNLTERTEKLFELHKRYKPIAVGYEQYGMQSDIEHIKYVQEQENHRFNITEVGGSMPKEDRIQRLIPVFEQGRFYMPKTLHYYNYEKRRVDYIDTFIKDEYTAFPVCIHDDMLDCRARIFDIGAKFPQVKKQIDTQPIRNYNADSWLG